MSDLIERLRLWQREMHTVLPNALSELLIEAAEALEAKDAEIARLKL
jgi:hypothetical protein